MAHGLFVGLITLDCIYRVDRVPARDEKRVAQDCLLVAGGPATNAAIAFAHWGHPTTLMAGLGQHPAASLVRTDLDRWGVDLIDLQPQRPDPPALSTVMVTEATGDRAVVSRNAEGQQIPVSAIDARCLEGVDMVLIDGHQMAVSAQIAHWAVARQIPVVIDGGSWKPGFDTVLPWATSVITSARFRLPGCSGTADTLTALEQIGVPEIAMTRGSHSILYRDRQRSGEIPVPQVTVQDTLGAGDIFHGAFCHYRLSHGFVDALERSAQVAARSCQSFGPRTWLES
ncbi:ribokinase [filamentous cyanobacterium CCP5]|nr:ribokinase [filamentous cyanobacterium CCP5]